MLKHFRALLFEKDFTSFPSQYSPDEAVRRLRSSVVRTAFVTLLREAVVGKVSLDKVLLYRYRPLFHNSFASLFRGSFQIRNGVTTLEGYFTLHWLVKTFMMFWFCSLLLFILIVVWALLIMKENKPLEGTLGIVVPLVMAAVGSMFVRFSKWLSRSDREFISKVIRDSIGKQDTSSPRWSHHQE